jgi:regulator of sigma D
MKILARIVYGFATLFGATGFLGCITGLVCLWMIYSSINRGVDSVFSRVDSSIDLVQRRIDLTQDRIELSMIAGSDLRRSLSDQKDEITARIELPPPLVHKAERLVFLLENVLEWLDTADASLTLIRQYEELPQLDPEAVETQSLRSLSEDISATRELCQKALDFTQQIIAASPEEILDTSEAKVARAISLLARTFNVLDEIQRRLQKLPDRIENLRLEADNIKKSIQSTTFYTVCTLTLFLFWMGAAQIALCGFGWKRLFYPRDTLAITDTSLSNQHASNADGF